FSVEDSLPKVRDTWYFSGGTSISLERSLATCKDVSVSPTGDAYNFLTLVSFDIGEQAPLAAATIMSRPGAVYASADSLYLAVRLPQSETDDRFPALGEGVEEATIVHKFDFADADGGAAKYRATGMVK